jgi:hypothetical protein
MDLPLSVVKDVTLLPFASRTLLSMFRTCNNDLQIFVCFLYKLYLLVFRINTFTYKLHFLFEIQYFEPFR